MPGWEKFTAGGLPLHRATVMAGLPGVVQGFTARAGGTGAAPYDSLNLGMHVGDLPGAVRANRGRLWAALGFAETHVAHAEQVHGDRVAPVTGGGMSLGADALITDTPDVLLALFYADCVPVYIVDPVGRSIGLAHAGWRGAASGIVGKTVAAMRNAYGGCPADYLAAVGPCIGAEHYEVGPEVADCFRAIGASANVLPKVCVPGKFLLDLRGVIFSQLQVAGLRAEAIAVTDTDTFRNRDEFFSYRRDGATGRMAAFLALRRQGEAKL